MVAHRRPGSDGHLRTDQRARLVAAGLRHLTVAIPSNREPALLGSVLFTFYMDSHPLRSSDIYYSSRAASRDFAGRSYFVEVKTMNEEKSKLSNAHK